MLDSVRPAFKRKVLKGKAKARARPQLLDDLDPVALVTKKAPAEPDAPKISRVAQYSKLATMQQLQDTVGSTDAKPPVDGVPFLQDPLSPLHHDPLHHDPLHHDSVHHDSVHHDPLQLSDPYSPMVVDSVELKPQLEPSTAGQVYVAPKTFLLRESHFRDSPVTLDKEYDTLSDEERPKVEYDDEPEDVSFAHDAPSRFDLDMYEAELMSVASEDDKLGKLKISSVPTAHELIAFLSERIQLLQITTEAQSKKISHLSLQLDAARATKEKILSNLYAE